MPRNRSTLVWSQVFKFLCSFKRRKSEKGTKPTQAERHTTAERRGSADRHFTRTNTTRTTSDLCGVGTAAFEVIHLYGIHQHKNHQRFERTYRRRHEITSPLDQSSKLDQRLHGKEGASREKTGGVEKISSTQELSEIVRSVSE